MNMNTPAIKIRKIVFLLLGMTIVLSACDDTSEKNEATTHKTAYSSQVAATVNGDEISIHQVKAKLVELPKGALSNLTEQEIKDQVLEELIKQQVVVQAALEEGLDRNPEVLTYIQEARNRILVGYYLKNRLSGVIQVSDDQVRQFYQDHSKLFNQRKQFDYLYIQTNQVDPGAQKALIQQLDKVGSETDLAHVLQSQPFIYHIKHVLSYSEQLPSTVLNAMYQMKPHDVGVVTKPEGLSIYFLKAVYNAPIRFEDAKQEIRDHIEDQARQINIQAITNNMRGIADVRYGKGFYSVSPITHPKTIAKATATPLETPEEDERSVAKEVSHDVY